ncbi:transposase [Neolewinella agarilytica]|uniref:IS701 family transposase n=1 Tax=Neolewinella agarilytica TaxID=478744 RepID=UPI002355B11B|nr:transposase [Neolewinella agarilytica]
MTTLPPEFLSVISSFSRHFTKPSWGNALVLLCGALLTTGSRTVCNCLRAVGYRAANYYKYHRFLSRARWSGIDLGGSLLRLLIHTFCQPGQALVIALDETIERRWGRRIAKRGIYRDAVRSSEKHKVFVSGLRWLVAALVLPLPWLKGKKWALPFFSALCPSKGYFTEGRGSGVTKKLTDYILATMSCLARWLRGLDRKVYLVGDGAYFVFDLLKKGHEEQLHWIVRGRMDALLYHFPSPKKPGTPGVQAKVGKPLLKMNKRLTDKRVKWQEVTFAEWYGEANKKMYYSTGKSIWYKGRHYRLPVQWVLLKDPEGKAKPTLLITTCLDIEPKQIILNFVARWQIEVTFAEVRRHLGIETQRQWSDLAIERTTPLLMGLFSVCCLLAKELHATGQLKVQATAWYAKKHITFSDVLLAVRRRCWQERERSIFRQKTDLKHYRLKLAYLWDDFWTAAA